MPVAPSTAHCRAGTAPSPTREPSLECELWRYESHRDGRILDSGVVLDRALQRTEPTAASTGLRRERSFLWLVDGMWIDIPPELSNPVTGISISRAPSSWPRPLPRTNGQ